MTIITMWAGVWLIMYQYLPAGKNLLAFLSVFVMVLMAIVICGTLRRWILLIKDEHLEKDEYGVIVKHRVQE